MSVRRQIERAEQRASVERARLRLIDEHAGNDELLRACCEALTYVDLVLAIRCGRL